jgi:hypothetical protein
MSVSIRGQPFSLPARRQPAQLGEEIEIENGLVLSRA